MLPIAKFEKIIYREKSKIIKSLFSPHSELKLAYSENKKMLIMQAILDFIASMNRENINLVDVENAMNLFYATVVKTMNSVTLQKPNCTIPEQNFFNCLLDAEKSFMEIETRYYRHDYLIHMRVTLS
jgi:hypothetical protein